MFRPVRTVSTLVAIVMLAGLLVLGSNVSAEAAPKARVSFTPAKPAAGERVVVAGVTPGEARTKVALQQARGKKWKTLATAKPSKAGKFKLRFTAGKAGAKTKYRVLMGSAVLATKTITARAHTGALTGATTLARGADGTFEATFTPSRPNAPVDLAVLSGSSWTTLARVFTDENGTATFQVNAAAVGAFTYGATAPAMKTYPQVDTTTHTLTITEQPTTTPTPTPTPTPTTTPTPSPEPQPDPLPEVIPLTDATAATIDSYDPTAGTFVFDDAAPAGVKTTEPGEIIAVGVSDATPVGALRTVASVTQLSGGRTQITTTDANLADAVAATSGGASDITVEDVDFTVVSTEVTNLAEGVTLDPAPAAKLSAAKAARQGIEVTGEAIGFDVDYAKELSNGTMFDLDGSMSVAPTADLSLDLDVDWDWLETEVVVKGYKLGGGAAIDSSLTASLTQAGELPNNEDEIEIAKVRRVLSGAIGVVPVVVVVEGALVTEVGLSGKAVVKADLWYSGRAVGGVQNTSSTDMSVDRYVENPEGDAVFSVHGSGTFTNFSGLRFTTDLYGAAGPAIKAGIATDAQFQIDAEMSFTKGFDWSQNSVWDYASCSLSIGRELDVAMSLSDAVEKVIGREVEASVWSSQAPPFLDLNCPDPGDVPKIVGTVPTFTAVAAPGYKGTLRAHDDRSGTWFVSAGALPPGLLLTQSVDEGATIVGTPTKNGVFTFTLRFEDSIGRKTSRKFTITVDVEWTHDDIYFGSYGYPGDPIALTHWNPQLWQNDKDRPHFGGYGKWTFERGQLPDGVRVISDPVAGVGPLAGTPTETGGYFFTLRNVDTDGTERLVNFRHYVRGVPFLGVGRVGDPFSADAMLVTANLPVPQVVAGELPPGLTLEKTADGVATLRGTPTRAGTYVFSLDNELGLGSRAGVSFWDYKYQVIISPPPG